MARPEGKCEPVSRRHDTLQASGQSETRCSQRNGLFAVAPEQLRDVISGVLSSLAGFVLIARIGAAEPIGGSGFELQAIGSAVIGGASLFGGVGNPLGSLVGALTLGALLQHDRCVGKGARQRQRHVHLRPVELQVEAQAKRR
ncbi:hypothetical protein CK219_23980 [Mesorhizobium sp. WSM4313]|nr:hypothetical protein CK219_23980 [Mesorhizobium sp. WSM4313]